MNKQVLSILAAGVFSICLAGGANATPIMTNGLVAYYGFENNASDGSGNGVDGRVVGDLSYSAGVVGQSASFNGNAHIVLDDFYLPIGNGSVLLWAYVGENYSGGALISTENNFGGGMHVFDNNTKMHIGTNTPVVTPISDGWGFYAYTYQNGTSPSGRQGAYINGQLETSTPGYAHNFNAPWLFNYINGTTIGTTVANTSIFEGFVDEVYIFNRSLTTEEILNVYNSTAPVPEPATMLLFGTGIVGLVGTRLRRKNK